jgi:hypothetical protein
MPCPKEWTFLSEPDLKLLPLLLSTEHVPEGSGGNERRRAQRWEGRRLDTGMVSISWCRWRREKVSLAFWSEKNLFSFSLLFLRQGSQTRHSPLQRWKRVRSIITCQREGGGGRKAEFIHHKEAAMETSFFISFSNIGREGNLCSHGYGYREGTLCLWLTDDRVIDFINSFNIIHFFFTQSFHPHSQLSSFSSSREPEKKKLSSLTLILWGGK